MQRSSFSEAQTFMFVDIPLFLVRGLEINKLRKIDEVFFCSDKTKNVDNAGHWRGFLTKYEQKITSSIT